MLTKNHLKYTTRNGKVFPKYIIPSDSKIVKIVSDMESIFRESVGKTSLLELASKLKQVDHSNVNDGLQKLLEDRCEFSEGDFEDIEAMRWQCFYSSINLRKVSITKDDFEERICKDLQDSLPNLRSKLYSDRPNLRSISSFQPIDPQSLIHRYNCAQIQGLIMLAKEVKVRIREMDLTKRRRLLQKAKFQGLIMYVEGFHDKDMKISLSGPLSVFEGSSSYGARLSNFFPYILQTDFWEIDAELKLKQKSVKLSVNSKKKILSHYSELTTYFPEDLKEFCSSLKKSRSLQELGWKVTEGNEILNLGKSDLCFPDLSFYHAESARKFHLEIFHKWHSSSLAERLRNTSKIVQNDIILAYPKKLVKDREIKQLAEEARNSGVKIVEYSSFPTVRAVLAYLKD